MATKTTASVGPRANFGLTWINRVHGKTPYWRAPKYYRPHGPDVPGENVNLSALRDHPGLLLKKCQELESEALAWRAGARAHVGSFDGTIKQIILKYLNDDESTFHKLRHGSKHPYEHYARRLIETIGDRRIDALTGIDLQRWHVKWSEGGAKLAAAKMMRAVLDAAVTYTIMSAKPGSPELRAASDLREIFKAASRKLPNPKRREHTVSAADVVRLRQAAHAAGRPSMALTYALVFETTLRLWDVIGQWWPVDEPLISEVVSKPYRSRKRAEKWFGLRWEDIGDDLVLRYVPSKTSAKTGLAVTFPLAKAPMVMEELAHWPPARRQGPVIVSEAMGLPYTGNRFGDFWRKDREAAGLPKHIWARDLRASGVSEGRAAAVATDDVAKVAGHASTKTTSAIYDRAALEAAERFAEARAKRRAEK